MRLASLAVATAARINELRRFAVFADESGASLLEYAIVLLIVSVVSVIALGALGNQSVTTLSTAAGSLSS